MINDLKTEQGMRLYWTYWKVYAGVKYWGKAGLAIGIYGGTWLVTICLYASVVIIPNANPFTLVYITFPPGWISCSGGIYVFAVCIAVSYIIQKFDK